MPRKSLKVKCVKSIGDIQEGKVLCIKKMDIDETVLYDEKTRTEYHISKKDFEECMKL